MTNGPVEPNAEMRQAAKGIREIFLALTYEGFSEQQALIIVGQMLTASMGGGQK